jgi:hypothetical protein
VPSVDGDGDNAEKVGWGGDGESDGSGETKTVDDYEISFLSYINRQEEISNSTMGKKLVTEAAI